MVKFLLGLLLIKSFSASIEEQRKYSFGSGTSDKQIETLLTSNLDGYSFYQHSRFKTYDIYLDSSDLILKKSGYSFRLRRVEKNKDSYEYAVQLKSEMVTFGAPRIEVEYKDFSKQFIDGQKLIETIDQLIETPNDKSLSFKISKWIELKKTSSLPPFQALRERDLIKQSFHPILLGYSLRERAHIYADLKNNLDFKASLKPSKKSQRFLDSYFKANPEKIWLMETSWDNSIFRKVPFKENTFKINELEIENKFRPRAQGSLMLDDLEQKLIKKYNIKPETTSKYFRAVEALLHE